MSSLCDHSSSAWTHQIRFRRRLISLQLLIDFCELVLGIGVGIFIGMQFLGQFIVGLLDLALSGAFGDPEGFYAMDSARYNIDPSCSY